MKLIKSFIEKKIINKVLILILFFLSFIIKKKQKLYIFWSINWQEYSWNTRFLYEYIKKNRKDLEVYFITKSKKIIEKNQDFIYYNSFKWIYLILRAKYIFINNYIYDILDISFLIWRFNIINLWHGEPIKKIEFSSDLIKKKMWFINLFLKKILYKNNYKMWICCSNLTKWFLDEAFLTNNFKITWLPRNDIFFKKQNKKTEIKNILYAPTFRDNSEIFSPFSKEELEKIDRLCIKNNYNFNIKLHPNTKSIENIDWNYKKIKVINGIDIQDLLYDTDILITDYSSVYIDFLLTKKPIFFYCYDLNEYLEKDREMYINYTDAIIKKAIIKNGNDIIKSIKNIEEIKEDLDYKNDYENILNKFHKYKKWWYCKKIISELDNL